MQSVPIPELLENGPVTIRWDRQGVRIKYAREPEGPGVLKRVENFVRSGKRHVSNGAPKASDADVAARFEICTSNRCGFFRGGKRAGVCKHKRCGCNVQSVRGESLVGPNKLRWADETCPVGFWGPVPSRPAPTAAGEKAAQE